MTKYTFAQMPQWAAKVDAIVDAVVSQATGDMLADIEVVPGINRGGSRQMGTIPRDFGKLAGSLQSSLFGSTAITQKGEDGYALVAANMAGGDVATFTWGTDEADYARHVHYGANGVEGTFWIDVAVAKWGGYVDAAVQRARAEITG